MILVLKSVARDVFKYFDFRYFSRFLLTLLALYGTNLFFIGLMIPGGLYSEFFVAHTNYIGWITTGLLQVSNGMLHLIGYDSYVSEIKILGIENGHRVIMQYQCVGLGLMSFWTAFVIAHKAGWKTKAAWVAGGLGAICLINSFRVAILLVALNDRWPGVKTVDHHELFNYIAYALIATMMYLYYRRSES